jgi:ATP-dependent helicase/nuclease subunit B
LVRKPKSERGGVGLDGANELARAVAKDKGAAFGWHRLSFPQLAAAIAAPVLATRGLAPLSRVGTEAIVAGLVHRLKVEGGLGRYQSVANTPGFPRAITGVIAELRAAQLPSAAVENVAPDLVPLIRAYERELTRGNFSDWAGVLQLATDSMSASHRHRLIGLPTLLLDVPISTEAELAFVTALAAAIPGMLATIPAADAATLVRFRDRLGFNVEDLDQLLVPADPDTASTGALARLQRHLFNEHEKPPEAEDGNEIEVFSAPGEGRECVEVARRVLALARDAIPFDRIAVLLRSPEDYRAHLKEAFARADIPAHFARGAMWPHPAGRAFCALLECAAEGLSARKFAEYLSLGQVPHATPNGSPPAPWSRGDLWSAPDAELVPPLAPENASAPPTSSTENATTPRSPDAPVQDGQLRAPRRWERLLVEAAVIGGRDRWRRRIDGLSNELRRKLAELGAEDETQATALARTLADLAAFARVRAPTHR